MRLFVLLFVFSNLFSQINWQNANSGIPYKINDIKLVDNLNGFAVADNGSNGYIIKTNDGGISWTKLLDNCEQGLQRICFINSTNIFAVGWYGKILKSTNAGSSWTDIGNTSISTEPLFGAYFFNSLIGVAVGGNGTVLRTANGGLDWTVQNIINQELWDIEFINNDVGYIISKGKPAKIFKTSNKGISWSEIYTEEGNSEFYNINFVDNNNGYIVGGKEGSGGIILKTTNGGLSWQKLTTNFVEWLMDIHFANLSRGFAVGSNGLIISTNDSGTTWSSQYIPTSLLKTIDINSSFAVVGGDFGKIYYSSLAVTPFLTITSPIGGEVWKNGEIHSVTWNSTAVSNIKILFSSNLGTTWFPLSNSFPVSSNSFNWTVPNTSSNECIMKLVSLEDSTIFSVSPVFSIQPLATNNKISLSLPQLSSKIGDTVIVSVIANLPAGRSISSFEINFNLPQSLSYQGFDLSNTLLGNSSWSFNANMSGNIVYAGGAGFTDITSSGTLFKLKYKILPNASGSIPLTFSSALINAGGIQLDLIEGSISISDVKYGDIDLNGIVQTYDASLVLKYVTGTVNLNSQQLANADVNLDGLVNSLDASLIIQYVLKIIPYLPVQGNFAAIGNLNMQNLASAAGASIDIPVEIKNSNNIKSFEGTFNYDINKLEFEGLEWPSSLIQFTKEVKLSQNNVVFVGAGSEQIQSNGLFVKLKFKIKSNYLVGQTQVLLSKLRWNANNLVLNPSSSTISVVTDIKDETSNPADFSLSQNFPNPFNPKTNINYTLPTSGFTTLKVYDLLGNLIETLFDGYQDAGYHTTVFPQKALSLQSGIYFYRLNSQGFSQIKRMILLK